MQGESNLEEIVHVLTTSSNNLSRQLFVDLLIPSNSDNNTSTEAPVRSTHPMVTRRKLKEDPTLASRMMLLTTQSALQEPKTLRTTMKDQRWVAAMKEELQALHDNNTWKLVPRPENVNVVGSKWVFRIKYKDDGSFDHFKAHLMAKGFTQVFGQDYIETYSPIIRPTTI